MARPSHLVILLAMTMAGASCSTQAPAPVTEQPRRWGIVMHGGASNFTLETIKDRETEMRAAMTTALSAGHRILAAGGSSLDAVQAAVVVLEDSPHFNAGKGAVFTHEGTNELDAAIMDGGTRMAGAVAGVKRIKNPIRARAAGHGEVAARDDGRRRSRGVREGAGRRRVRPRKLLPYGAFAGSSFSERSRRRAAKAGRDAASAKRGSAAGHVLRNGRRGRARSGREPRGCDLDGRCDQQAVRPRR